MTNADVDPGVLGRAVYGAHGPEGLEVWRAEGNVTSLEVIGGELAAVCPVTRNPDLYDYLIELPPPFDVESKSLKMYLLSFRDRPISCADLCSAIAHDLSAVTGAPVAVSLTQQTRGGMRLSASATGVRP